MANGSQKMRSSPVTTCTKSNSGKIYVAIYVANYKQIKF